MLNDIQTPIDPKLIERIRKTLALANDGGATEAEAATAGEFAEKLMRKHNLTLAQVEAGGGVGEAGSKRTQQGQKGRAQYEFQQQLMLACAETNFCVALKDVEWRRGRTFVTGFTLIGREANVVAAQLMFDYLMTTVERLAFDYVGRDNRQRLSRAAVSFKQGAADRLIARLKDRHRVAMEEQAREAAERNAAALRQGGAGTALAIVLRDYATEERERNEDFRYGRPEGTTTRMRRESEWSWEITGEVERALKRETTPDKDHLTAVAMRAGAEAVARMALAVDVGERLLKAAVANCVYFRLEDLRPKAPGKVETEAQRRAREAKEARQNERWWQQQRARERREDAKRDHGAYAAGHRAGKDVGLDKQVNNTKTPSSKRIG